MCYKIWYELELVFFRRRNKISYAELSVKFLFSLLSLIKLREFFLLRYFSFQNRGQLFERRRTVRSSLSSSTGEALTSVFFACLCSRTGSWLRARCLGETPLEDGPRCKTVRGSCWLRRAFWSASESKFIGRKAPHNGTQPWSSVTTSPPR